jgi:hypothetical protein
MSWGAQNRSKDAKNPSASRGMSKNPKTGVMRYPAIGHCAAGATAPPRKRIAPESKPEPDFSGADLGVRSGRGPQSPSPRGSPICFGPESPTEPESKGEPDLARHLLRFIRPGFVWSVRKRRALF